MQREKIGRRGTTNAGLEPYPDYKPSGVEWLGDMPAHWGMRRLKVNAENVVRQTRGRRHEEVYIALEHVESWTGKIRKADSDVDFDSQVKQFREGDVLFGKLRPYLAKVARPAGSGVCVGEFLVLRPHADNLLPGYLEQLLRSKPIIDVIDASTFGAKMPRADWRFIGNLALPLPPLAEQAAIAHYLDNVTGRIRRCIDTRERLIGLLEEKRRAVIHRAVTRGLDPNVRLKPSGVEWLGDVPAHWETRRLRTVARIVNGATPSTNMPAYWDGDIVWLTPEDLGRLTTRYIEDGARRITQEGYESCGTNLAPVGSLAISTRAPIGHLGVLRSAACVNQGCRLLVPNEAIQYGYLYYELKTARYDLEALGQGSTFMELSRGKLAGFTIVVPPLAEQAAIAAHLDKATAAIDAAVACARRQIELLREYRARLIADVVTGKLDVREATANLPDESGESVVLFPEKRSK